METVSSANAGIINLQIAGVSPDYTIAITLNDDYALMVVPYQQKNQVVHSLSQPVKISPINNVYFIHGH